MPYVSHPGFRVHYEVDGAGPPLVLRHGLGYRVEDWYTSGWAQALRSDYRLILIDPRGQGQSDKPHHRPDRYSRELMAEDVVKVLDDLGIAKAHYLGYSQGAIVGFPLARIAPDRFMSYIFIGGFPHQVSEEGRARGIQRLASLRGGGMEAYIRDMEARPGDGPMPPQLRDLYFQNDVEALAAVIQAMNESPDYQDIVPTIAAPCLVLAGDAGGAVFSLSKDFAALLPNGAFVPLPGLTHRQEFEHSGVVRPHVTQFLAEVSQSVGSELPK